MVKGNPDLTAAPARTKNPKECHTLDIVTPIASLDLTSLIPDALHTLAR